MDDGLKAMVEMKQKGKMNDGVQKEEDKEKKG